MQVTVSLRADITRQMGEQTSPDLIISSFPHGISIILLDLGSWDNFGRLESRIRDRYFRVYVKFETRGVYRMHDKYFCVLM